MCDQDSIFRYLSNCIFELDLLYYIYRIYQEARFCDVELIADSESVFTNCCVLQARVPKFYTQYISHHVSNVFICGVTKIYFPDTTFITIQTFIDCVYSNDDVSSNEARVIEYLQEVVNSINRSCVVKNCLSSDTESFYTPECSPSVFSKPFDLYSVDTDIYRQKQSVRSYYTIVSVDDADLYKDKTDSLLDKELAEQEELFKSFQLIKSKEKVDSSHSIQRPQSKRTKKLTLDLQKHKKLKPQTCRSNLTNKKTNIDKLRNDNITNDTSTDILDKYQDLSWCSEMEMNGHDSGLDNSLQISIKEQSTSETSGIDVTEPADTLEDDCLHGKCVESSPTSSVSSTADSNQVLGDDCVATPCDLNMVDSCSSDKTICPDLPTEDIKRLDEMERNIEQCEKFLNEERSSSYDCLADIKQDVVLYEPENVNNLNNEEWCNNTNHNEQQFSLNLDTKSTFYHCEMCSPSEENKSFTDTVEQNLNIMNNKLSAQDISDTSKKKVEENPTPPCSPLKNVNCLKIVEDDDLPHNEVKSNYFDSTAPVANNYFIDASSLLDESEITTPPISLTSCKNINEMSSLNDIYIEDSESSKYIDDDVPLVNYPASGPNSCEIDGVKLAMMREVERQQGELIFKTSIPHYSLHDVDGSNRLRGGDDLSTECDRYEYCDEQVVPSGEQDELTTDAVVVEAANNVVHTCSEETNNECRKVSMDAFPIVSGGVSPMDYSTTPSSTGSPLARRRNENVPILSGGSEYVEEKKIERKLSQSTGSAWIVDMSDSNEQQSHEANNHIPVHKTVRELKKPNKRERNASVGYFIDISQDTTQDTLEVKDKNKPAPFPIEKSASLGYFLDFGKSLSLVEGEEKSLSRESLEKKNLFSMFIDINESKPKDKRDKVKKETETLIETDKKVQSDANGKKKGFFMFIEHESPVPKRKISVPVKNVKPENESVGSFKRSHKRAQSLSVKQDKNNSIEKQLSTSDVRQGEVVETNVIDRCGSLKIRKQNKFPLKTCDNKITWEEQNHVDVTNTTNESWLATKDVQITYTGKTEVEETGLKKDNTFIIDGEKNVKRNKKNEVMNNINESPKSPFKSPKSEERDSGVVATEESDDGFVKLSDMDKEYKNPYYNENKKKMMSKSITETNDNEHKTLHTIKSEDAMSKSVEGSKTIYQNGLTRDTRVSRSLSRIFPNLNLSASFSSKRNSSLISPGYQDDELLVSEVSEISSMQSSVGPSCLEISTSETDVSSHAGPVSRLGEDLLRMFLEEISPDVVVDVGGRRMKAHKCILSSRCQYFAAMLSGGWVESAGNVISLQGFSYNVVHFALCHIYSGESQIPDSLNLIELATLADMLCLEGLKEVISYTMKVKYCHFFHNPCAGCMVGVLDCLPVTAAYGLDDLYRKCLRWIAKHFVRIWPTKTFSSLPKELLDKCYQYHVVHMSVESILDTVLSLDKLRGMLPNVRWAEIVSRMVNKLQNAAIKYIADHYSSVLTSDSFLALGKEAGWSISCFEDILMEATERLPPEQACWSHARLHRILALAVSDECPEEMRWHQDFIELLQKIASSVENNLVKQAPRAARSKAWRQMEPELRSRIQEAACLVLPDECNRSLPRKGISESSSTSSVTQRTISRSFDIRQVKLAMTQQQSTQLKKTTQRTVEPVSNRRSVVVKNTLIKQETNVTLRKSYNKVEQADTSIPKAKPTRLLDIKSRYLEQRSPLKVINDKTTAPPSGLRATGRQISSSDSSRTCSPAMRRAAVKTIHKEQPTVNNKLTTNDKFKKLKKESIESKTLGRITADETMSTDSLATESSYGEKEIRSRSAVLRNVDKKISSPLVNRRVQTPLLAPRIKTNQSTPNVRRSMVDTKTSPSLKNVSLSKVNDLKQSPKNVQTRNQMRAETKPMSPRTNTARAGRQQNTCVNGNVINKRNSLDVENNRNVTSEGVRPTIGSRSGTFLKDEPTILKKPQVANVHE